MIGKIQKGIAHVAWFFVRNHTRVEFRKPRGTRQIVCDIRILGWLMGTQLLLDQGVEKQKPETD